jgi:hypothetical protein
VQQSTSPKGETKETERQREGIKAREERRASSERKGSLFSINAPVDLDCESLKSPLPLLRTSTF